MTRRTGWVLAVLLAACTPDPVSPPTLGGLELSVSAVPAVYIVQLVRTANPGAVAASVGASPRFVYRHAITGFAAELPDAAVEALWRNPLVENIEPDGVVRVSAVASWGLDRIDQRGLPLDGTYTAPNAGAGVHAYIIDTGIHRTHQEFGGRASFMASFIPEDGWNGDDCYGHGTHVAGTVAGVTTGVASATQVHDVRVLGCGGSGTWEQVIAGMDLVAGQRQLPCVVNMSLGGGFMQTVNDAVQGMIDAGCVVAAASGNSNADAAGFSPASAPNALTVNASDITDARAYFSNYGAITDLYAPGVSITSAMSNGTIGRCDNCYASWSGTSMAAPHVAGAAAQVLASSPGLTPAQVAAVIVGNATPSVISGNPLGTPNLLLFVTGSGEPPPPPPPPPPTDNASFTASCIGFVCTFTPVSSGAWAFGDNTEATDPALPVPIEHTYAPRRKYLVTHTVGTATASRSLNCNPRKCLVQ